MNKIYKTRKILFVILLSSIAISTNLFAQDTYKRKICISEWVAEMESCTKEFYVLRNTEIYYHYLKDTLYAYYQPRSTPPTDKDKQNEITVQSQVYLENCKLPDNKTCQLRNVIFNENVAFYYCDGASQFILYNCTFKQGIDFILSSPRAIEFWYCSILQRTVLNDLQISKLSYTYCSFYTDSSIVDKATRFGYEKENQTYQFLFNIYQTENKIGSFDMSFCKILPSTIKPVIFFHGGKYDDITFVGTDFKNSIINLESCSIKEKFWIQECKFTQPLGLSQLVIPEGNTSLLWDQLDSVGLGLYQKYKYDLPPYTYKNDTLISDIYIYNELNSSYKKFYSMYLKQGDIESANACLIQMKDMETQKYKYLYEQDAEIHKWFNWRFNQFLKYFSRYGTNPVHSLIFSMWTILVFAGLYFFFYSDWDGINRTYLIRKHRQVMQYFRSEQRLEDFYTQTYTDDLKSFAEYKAEIKENRKEIPSFIALLGRPLYILSVVKHKLATFIYRRTEILHGRWIDLKPIRKVFVGTTVFFSIIIYLAFLTFIRALNAVTLSINAFSTLGFGTIPVKGASRYVTIIQGFIGWFLLTIFSVSLISQMIQN
jgi:hypothetical protein